MIRMDEHGKIWVKDPAPYEYRIAALVLIMVICFVSGLYSGTVI